MTEHSLSGCTILVVEDEYLLAVDLCTALAGQDARIVGPAATVAHGNALVQSTQGLSSAILDVNLRGETVFGLADELIVRDVPFVFATGYDASIIPERFRNIVRCEKPVRMAEVFEAIGRMVDGGNRACGAHPGESDLQ